MSNIIIKRKKSKWKKIVSQRYLFFMSMPFVIWVIIFAYVPIWGWIMAFQNYRPSANRTMFQQQWVGLKNFNDMLHDQQFFLAVRNTLGMGVFGLLISFVLTIIFALLLNEVKNVAFKRTVQTFSYLPHFISWVIAASMVIEVLSIKGIFNSALMAIGLIHKPIQFLAIPHYFWWIIIFATVWKEIGWTAIIYLAAISGIDPSIYEAATVDGANRYQKIWYVTLPGIMPTVMVMLIISIGGLMNLGFESQMLIGNALVIDKADVIDWYILRQGIQAGRYSYGTAIGVFKSVVSLVLLLSANFLSKKFTDNSVI